MFAFSLACETPVTPTSSVGAGVRHLPGATRPRGELLATVPPLGLLVHRVRGDVAQAADHRAVEAGRGGGELSTRRLVHERHELVGEARHGAADADAAHVRAATDTVDPPALGDVAVHDGTPTAELDDA